MSDTQDSPSEPQPKKRSLDDLLPDKQVVETSIGTLFVRHLNVGDLEAQELEDPALGKTLVRQLCSRAQSKRDAYALADEDLAALIESDFRLLAPAIAARNDWNLPTGGGLVELGIVAKAGMAADRASIAKGRADLNASLKSKYDFLGDSVLGKLQSQMGALNKLVGLGSSSDQARKWASSDLERITALTGGLKPEPLGFAVTRTIDAPRINLPRPEETKIGRATLASAEYSKQSSEKIDALVQVVAGLNQTVVSEILPAWAKKFADDQAAGKHSFEQAARGLRWTQLAVYLSVLVTALATGWQIWVAYAIDGGNAAQQKRVEEALREQLAAQRTMIEQQAREGAMLRDALTALKPKEPIGTSELTTGQQP